MRPSRFTSRVAVRAKRLGLSPTTSQLRTIANLIPWKNKRLSAIEINRRIDLASRAVMKG